MIKLQRIGIIKRVFWEGSERLEDSRGMMSSTGGRGRKRHPENLRYNSRREAIDSGANYQRAVKVFGRTVMTIRTDTTTAKEIQEGMPRR